MPCDYRILQIPSKEQVKLVHWETVARSQVNTQIIYNIKKGLYQNQFDTDPFRIGAMTA